MTLVNRLLGGHGILPFFLINKCHYLEIKGSMSDENINPMKQLKSSNN